MNASKDEKLLLRFAKHIKKLRLEKGVTQEMAYEDTGVHFGRIEQGKRDVSLTTIAKLSKYFNKSISELLEGI